MKVFCENSLQFTLFFENKKVNIDKAELYSKLSEKIKFPEAILLLCRLPYIEWIKYDKAENSLTYQFRNANISYNSFMDMSVADYEQETLSEIEEIGKIFENFF